MRFSDEVLMAYADNELQGELQAEVQRAIESDPEVARRVAEHATLRRSLEDSFGAVLDEPVPAHLIAAARRRSTADQPSQHDDDRDASKMAPLRPRGWLRLSLPQWAGLAATFLLGMGSWQLIQRNNDSMLVERGGTWIATGTLAQALSNQLVPEQTIESTVQIGISFRSKSGEYCRTFQIPPSSVGMACHSGSRWQIQMLGQNARAAQNAAGYRQAASAVPAWLALQVDSLISGEPLDMQTEANARAHGWK